MIRVLLVFFPLLTALSSANIATGTTTQGTVHAISKSKYTRAHSLGDHYHFSRQDGWENVNITNLRYKYAQSNNTDTSHTLQRRERKKGSKSPKKLHGTKNKPSPKEKGGSDVGGTVKHILGGAWNGLKALGGAEPVTITWYARPSRTSISGLYLILTGTLDMIC